MRAPWLHAIAICLCVLSVDALAQSAGRTAQHIDICADDRQEPDTRIRACTAVIRQETDRQQLSNAHNNRGVAFASKKDKNRAFAEYTQAIQSNAASAVPYVNRGDIYFQRGAFDKAIKDFDKAISLQPDLERPYMGRSLAYLKINDAQRALSSADEMLRNAPKSPIAAETRAYVLKAMGRRDEAIAAYRKALDMSAEIPQLRQEIEAALRELGASP